MILSLVVPWFIGWRCAGLVGLIGWGCCVLCLSIPGEYIEIKSTRRRTANTCEYWDHTSDRDHKSDQSDRHSYQHLQHEQGEKRLNSYYFCTMVHCAIIRVKARNEPHRAQQTQHRKENTPSRTACQRGRVRRTSESGYCIGVCLVVSWCIFS